MPTILLWTLLLAGPGRAASRLVITVQGPYNVVLDQVPVTSAASLGRTTLSVDPGRHQVQVRDAAGAVLYSATITVPDGVSATGTWDGAAMTWVGAAETTAVTVPGDVPLKADGDEPPPEDVAALERANDPDPANQLASAHGQRAVDDHHPVGGRIPGEVTDVVGDVATTTLGVSSPTRDLVVGAAAGAITMLDTAAAGGLGRRYSPDARQGNPNVPPPVLEEVRFHNEGGRPMRIYVDGMWLDDFAEGETDKTFKLEVGSRRLQFADLQRQAVIYEGSLRVREDFVIELSFSPTSPPVATNANWAWAPN
ncbi:MAG: hypothetical protein D6798_15630 [Deltaproteobacteria bacterium]|nr:MAG: hypothetical protein D6798_15630 [Deltaproteobacteria bacterium]